MIDNNSNSNSNINIQFDQGVQAISAGRKFTCAIIEKGKLVCFGRDQYGQLSTPSSFTSNLLDEGVQAISTGANHACAINYYGTLSCWG